MEILSWEVTPHFSAASLFNWAQVPLTEPFYGRSLSNRKSQKLFPFVKMVEQHEGESRHFNYIFCSKRQPYTVKLQWPKHLGNHEICSRQGKFELMSVNQSARSRGIVGISS